MDINLPKSIKQPALSASTKVDSLNLKINQQLDVKVISTKLETQSLILELSQSKQSLHVQSDAPVNTKTGQSLQLLVTKLTPVTEFKIINTEPKTSETQLSPEAIKAENLKSIILKQVSPKTHQDLSSTVKNITSKNSVSTASLSTTSNIPIVTAKILAISDRSIKLQLHNFPTTAPVAYSKKLNQNILQQLNPVIKLKIAQLGLSELNTTPTSQKQLNTATTTPVLSKQQFESLNLKQGQDIQLEIKNSGKFPEFKLLVQPQLNLVKGQVISAKLVAGNSELIQLAINKNLTVNNQPKNTNDIPLSSKLVNIPPNNQENSLSTAKITAKNINDIIDPLRTVTKLSSKQENTSIVKTNNIFYTKNPPVILSKETQVIALSPKQLLPSADKNITSPPTTSINISTLKPNQQLSLEVTKTGLHPEFKILNAAPAVKSDIPQVITAKVVDIRNDKIQLQIQTPVILSGSKNQANTNNQTTTISLNKNQLTSPVIQSTQANITNLSDKNNSSLKIGQEIKLEVIKTSEQTEYRLVDNKSIEGSNQKILQAIKEALPIQQAPSEAINQIIHNIALLKGNEKIPDALKRIAREILDNIPQSKDLNNPKQLKQAISQSGLFLEAKLAQSTEQQSNQFQSDFKNLLLKFDHALKQEIASKKESNTTTNELSLVKEMQQKTESSLARIILNQLTSLPKEEGLRQVWLLDLPFIHKENTESVKIEVNRDNGGKSEDNEENWSVNITVTPPGLSTIHCKISCINKEINTRFWSDNQQVVGKIVQNLSTLKTQFEKAGITPGHMSAHKGVAKNTVSHQQITNQSLFNQEV